MKMILGKKIGMTRVYNQKNTIVPVTLILANSCFVTQVRTKEKDGYFAIQLGTGKKKRVTRAERGHIDKANKQFVNFSDLCELRLKDEGDLKNFKIAQEIKVDNFKEGEIVDVSAFSKGRGFAGVVKRHGFHGQSTTHGHKHDIRKAGSIGCTDMQRVQKGMRMAGHMGNERVTLKNLEVLKIDKENNLIAVKGAVPGARNGFVTIKSSRFARSRVAGHSV